nr:CIH_HP1_G0014060.mRNA.1.CDS.1 [Saccharomyces cerevisiae]
MKDFMRLYSNLVERCFTDCVNDFTTSKLTNKEQTCIMKCSEKFLKHSGTCRAAFPRTKRCLGTRLGPIRCTGVYISNYVSLV